MTIAPRDALFQNAGGQTQIGYGAEVSYYFDADNRVDLERDTAALIRQLGQENTGLREDSRRNDQVGGQPAIVTTLTGPSPYAGDQEVDALVTVARPQGLFYFIYISPKSEFAVAKDTFEKMVRSIHFL